MILTNNPTLQFKSLDDEKYRVYEFTDGSSFKIANPVALHVSNSGGHRVLAGDGVSHYIPTGWVHLYWEVKEGAPAFSF